MVWKRGDVPLQYRLIFYVGVAVGTALRGTSRLLPDYVKESLQQKLANSVN